MDDHREPLDIEPLNYLSGQVGQMAARAVLIGLQEAERLIMVQLARTLRRADPGLRVPEPPPLPAASADLMAVGDSMQAFVGFAEEMGRVLDRLGDTQMGEREAGQAQGLLDALQAIMERRRAVSDLLEEG